MKVGGETVVKIVWLQHVLEYSLPAVGEEMETVKQCIRS
jgi:hypothetical protein